MAANQERAYLAQAAALLVGARSASLATVADGLPHAALVTPALDADGWPFLLLSGLAKHTKHLRANPACALLVAGAPATHNPQTAPRVTLGGIAVVSDDPALAPLYLRAHPYAEQYISFSDFHFWKLICNDVRFIGGFAAAVKLNPAALQHEIKSARRAGCG